MSWFDENVSQPPVGPSLCLSGGKATLLLFTAAGSNFGGQIKFKYKKNPHKYANTEIITSTSAEFYLAFVTCKFCFSKSEYDIDGRQRDRPTRRDHLVCDVRKVYGFLSKNSKIINKDVANCRIYMIHTKYLSTTSNLNHS